MELLNVLIVIALQRNALNQGIEPHSKPLLLLEHQYTGFEAEDYLANILNK